MPQLQTISGNYNHSCGNDFRITESDDVFAISINGIFYLTCLNKNILEEKLRKTVNLPIQKHFLLKNFEQVENFFGTSSKLISFLFSGFLNDYITIEIKSDKLAGENVLLSLTGNPSIVEFINIFDTPLQIQEASIESYPPANNIKMLKEYFGDRIKILGSIQNKRVPATVLHYIDDNNIEIIKPGALSYKELRKILPKSIKIFNTFKKTAFQYSIENYFKLDNLILSKEDFPIIKQFAVSEIDYSFIGTRTNPEGMAKNLINTVFNHKQKNSFKTIKAVGQNFSKHHLRDYINYSLNTYSFLVNKI
jgi:tRNA A37 threonylcarbamoyladenosine synthetase subunit TsaC/SUA5/YrdC